MRVTGQQVLLLYCVVGGAASPAPRGVSKFRAIPNQVIFSARCTRYTIYRNSPTIKLPSTQI